MMVECVLVDDRLFKDISLLKPMGIKIQEAYAREFVHEMILIFIHNVPVLDLVLAHLPEDSVLPVVEVSAASDRPDHLPSAPMHLHRHLLHRRRHHL